MGNCLKPTPTIDADVETDGNVCCSSDTCPSACCYIVIQKSRSRGSRNLHNLHSSRSSCSDVAVDVK